MNQFIIHNDIEFIYSKTGNIWHNFRNKKIFITGGTGFFGCWLLETIKWLNENKQLDLSATILTRNYKKFFKKAPHLANYSFFNFVEGDIKSFNFFHDNYHALIHFAATNAEETYHGEDELNKFITITCGTKRVLDFAIENNIKNILVTSSGAVYGKQAVNIQNIMEEYSVAPNSTDISAALGHGKRIEEFFCSYYAQKFKLKIKIARCFSFVGPYLQLNIHYAIGNFIRDVLNGGPIVIKGDGTAIRSYLYAADLIIWLITILAKGKSIYPYNVGSDESIDILTLARLVARCSGRNINIIIEKQKHFNQAKNIYVPSIQRARKELGLKVYTSLKDAIQKTFLFYK
jgi:dTDP-glucose 4,6-dehydratase